MRPILSTAAALIAGLLLSAPTWAQTPAQRPNVIQVPPPPSNPALRPERLGPFPLTDDQERLRISEEESRRIADRRADPEPLSRRIEFRGDPTPAPAEPLPSGTRPLQDIIVRPQ